MKKLGLIICLLIVSLFSFEEYMSAAPNENGWVTKTPMPTGRYNAAGEVVDGKIYVYGGTPGIDALNKLEIYDPATDTWTTGQPGLSRYGAASAVVDGKIYFMGGYNGTSDINSVQVYDPVSNRWSSKQGMPTANRFFTAVPVGKEILTFGGISSSTSVYSYDTEKNTWTIKKQMPFSVSVFKYNESIYGLKNENGNAEIYHYNHVEETWTLVDEINSVLGKTFEYKGKLVSIVQNSVYTYDLTTKVLSQVPNSEFRKRGTVYAISNDKLYMLGGTFTDSGTTSGGMGVVEEFDLSFLNESEVPEPNPEPNPEPQPSGDRAILLITMTTGLEKEYDLPMSDITSFLNWYDARDAGTGPAKYSINKYGNNKGPFSKRTEYVIFDKILTFEVNEYSIN